VPGRFRPAQLRRKKIIPEKKAKLQPDRTRVRRKKDIRKKAK